MSVGDDDVLVVAPARWYAEQHIGGLGGMTQEAAEAWLGFTGR